MVEKVTNPAEFLKLLDDLDELFLAENQTIGHLLPIKKESLAQIANPQLLTWTYHVWANKSGEKYDGLLIFVADNNVLFGEIIWTELLWLSKESFAGTKMLKQALDFGKEKGYKYYAMGRTARNPKQNLTRFYNSRNLQKDGEIYIGKL